MTDDQRLERVEDATTKMKHAVFGVNGDTGMLNRIKQIEKKLDRGLANVHTRLDRLILAILAANAAGAVLGAVLARLV